MKMSSDGDAITPQILARGTRVSSPIVDKPDNAMNHPVQKPFNQSKFYFYKAIPENVRLAPKSGPNVTQNSFGQHFPVERSATVD